MFFIKDGRRFVVRAIFYIPLLFLVAPLLSFLIRTTKYPEVIVTVMVLVILVLIVCILIEFIVWLISKFLLWINYFGEKKPKRYARDIQRFVAIYILVGLSLFLIFSSLIKNIDIEPLQRVLENDYSWQIFTLMVTIITIFSLIGLFKLKKWGMYLFIFCFLIRFIENIYRISMAFQFSLLGLLLPNVYFSLIISFPLIYYVWIRRKVLK